MKIIVTGNLGYIGSVLVPRLLALNHEVTGFDIGYFRDCLLSDVQNNFYQVQKDIRDIANEDLEGFDVVIHLAGLSNDPLGELQHGLTEDINLHSTIRLAKFAKQGGVKRFIYASSQSMYGISDTREELDEDLSEKHPVTAYAKTKWDAELEIFKLQTDIFTVCAFRPSTVFGVSPRLRCDIVFNNLVACAYTTKKIEIKSDGTPWRPVVHIQDVCSAFIAGISAPDFLIAGRAFNVGVPDGNYSVRELAEAAQKAVPGSQLIFTGEHGSDSRTYKVSFRRILEDLKDYYVPEWDLQKGANELIEYFDSIDFRENDFRGSKTNRLFKINELIKSGIIDSGLRFNK